MTIYKLGTVFSTGLLATSLLLGGCQGTTPSSLVGPAGPQGPAGPAGGAGAGGALLEKVDRSVACRFDFEDEDHAARDKTAFRVTTVAVDDRFQDIDGTAQPQVSSNAEGIAVVKAPKGFVKHTCRDSSSGEEVIAYDNLSGSTGGGAQADALVVDNYTDAVWNQLAGTLSYNGYKDNTDWSSAAMRDLEAAARDDGDLQDDFENDGLQSANNAAHVRAMILDRGDILVEFALPPVCLASKAPAWEFDTTGTLTDLADTGDDSDFDVSFLDADSDGLDANDNSCELLEFNGVALDSLVYTINSTVNDAVDGSANGNDAADVTCSGFDSDNDRLDGIVGRSVNANDNLTDQSMEWYAIRLAFGTDRDNASHVDADAVYLGAAIKCEDTSDDDCDLDSGSIAINLGTNNQEVLFSDDQDDFDTVGDLTVTDKATAFVISPDTRATQDENSVVTIVKNCAPSDDLEFSYTDTTALITLSVSSSVTITKEDEDERNGHFGFVVAQLDPADAAHYEALVKLARQNISGDAVSAFATTSEGQIDDLLPWELGVLLATGNGLCDPAFAELSGDDFNIGASEVARPNIAVAGMPFGEDISFTCSTSDDADRIVAENGITSARCVLKAGDDVTITAGTATQTCTAVE